MGELKKNVININYFNECFWTKDDWWSSCPQIAPIPDFDVTRYLGEWFDVGRYPMSFQSDEGRCGGATYGATDDEFKVSVNNSEISPASKGQYKRVFLIGEAVQTDPVDFP